MYYINDIHGDNLKNEKGRALFEYVREKYEGVLLDTDKDVQAVSKDIREKEKELAKEYPYYDWASNKGYPTKKHRLGIKEHGVSPYHRKSYNLLGSEELSLDFKD